MFLLFNCLEQCKILNRFEHVKPLSPSKDDTVHWLYKIKIIVTLRVERWFKACELLQLSSSLTNSCFFFFFYIFFFYQGSIPCYCSVNCFQFQQLMLACLNIWVQDKALSSMTTFCDLNNSHPVFCLTIQELAKKDTLLTRCWCNDVYNRFSIIMAQPSTSFISCFFLDFFQYVSKSNHVHWMYVTYPNKTTAKGTYSRE